jgi:hypothetical protein
MNKLKGITNTVKIITLAIVLSFGVSLVYAWTAPTVAPPEGNSTAPLNTSTSNQAKDGTLVFTRVDGVQGVETYGKALLATVLGLVGVGTASPWAKLTIENQYDPNVVPDLAVGNTDFASSNIAFTNGLTSAEATISTEGSAGDTDFRIKTKANGTWNPADNGILKDRFVVDWDGTVGINTSFPSEALTVGGVIETKAGSGGMSGVKFADGTVQTTAAPWPTGNYCILRAGGSCPAGFTGSSLGLYVGAHAHDMCNVGTRVAGDSNCTLASPMATLTLMACCK